MLTMPTLNHTFPIPNESNSGKKPSDLPYGNSEDLEIRNAHLKNCGLNAMPWSQPYIDLRLTFKLQIDLILEVGQ